MLRPLFWFGERAGGEALDAVRDQFAVGPALMQAPRLVAGVIKRRVLLPAGGWYDLSLGRWLAGDVAIEAPADAIDPKVPRIRSPFYAREGTIIPMQSGQPTDHRVVLDDIELHVFLHTDGSARIEFRADDGENFGYRRGQRSPFAATVTATTDTLEVVPEVSTAGWRPLRIRFVVYGGQRQVWIAGGPVLDLVPHT